MSHSTPELRPVPGIIPTIRDRWPLVASLLVLGLLAGYLAATVFPQEYKATTTVQIGPGLVTIGDVANDNSLVGPEQAAIATLDPQLDRIARTLKGGVTQSDVGKHLTVANRPDTSLLDFSYTESGRAEAERAADVSADVYLQRAKEIAESRLALQAKQIEQNLTTAPLDQRVSLQAQLRALNTTVVTPGAVLKDSAGTAQRSGIPTLLFAPLGALTGLLLGLVIAYLLEGRRPRVRPGAPLPLGPVEHLGRIRRDDTPQSAGAAFVIPALAETSLEDVSIGLVVLGGREEELVEFARAALVSAGAATQGKVVAIDLTTSSGLRSARQVEGVVLLVRERASTIEDVDSALRRLQRIGVAAYGVITAPPTGPATRPEEPEGDSGTDVADVEDRPEPVDVSDEANDSQVTESAPMGEEPADATAAAATDDPDEVRDGVRDEVHEADIEQGERTGDEDSVLAGAPRVPVQATGSPGRPWSRTKGAQSKPQTTSSAAAPPEESTTKPVDRNNRNNNRNNNRKGKRG